MKPKTRSLTRIAILFALALVLSVLESFLAPFFAFAPGLKPGLSNVVVLFSVLTLGLPAALCIAVLKCLFVFIVRGIISSIFSLAGGVLSVFIMWLLKRILSHPTYTLISISGAISHNLGQLLAVSLFYPHVSVYTYVPVLLIAGVLFGFITAMVYAGVSRGKTWIID